MRHALPALLLALTALSPMRSSWAVVPQAQHALLGGKTLEQWSEIIDPKPAELEFLGLAWRSEFLSAALEAHASHKPILLWAMNGHPLGCT